MFTTEFKPVAASAIFGSSRGNQIPATYYLSFNNTTGTELSPTRVRVPNTDDMWLTTSTGVENQTPIMSVAPASWIIGSVSLWTLPTGGVQVCTIALDEPLTVGEGDDLSFDVGQFKVDIA